MFISRLENKA